VVVINVSLALSTRRGETQVAGKPKPVMIVSCTAYTYEWDERLERSPMERDLGVWIDGKLNESTVCPGSQKGQLCPGVHQAHHR